LEELLEFVAIPSISAQSAHQDDMRSAAQFIGRHLSDSGVQNVQIMPTAGHPVVFASHHVSGDKPTVLVYGHYDVQPPDPLGEWLSPPFEPLVQDGIIRARGVS